MQNNFSQHKKNLLIFAVIVLAIIGVAWMLFGGARKNAHASADNGPVEMMIRKGDQIVIPANSPLRTRVKVQDVAVSDAAHVLEIPAQVEADPARTINILPPVAGKVLELKVGLGDHVQKGQLLLVLASGDFAQATSDVQKARDALQLAKKTLDRQRGVQDAGGGAVKDLEGAQSSYVQAESEFTRADTRLKSLSTAGAVAVGSGPRLNIVAPESGTISALSIGVGQSANDPTASMMTIANLDKVWITANVPENMISAVRKGQTVDMSLPAYPGQKFQGQVAFISDILQPDTRRTLVRISVSNTDKKFKSNMFANAAFSVTQNAEPIVPTSALLMNNDDTTVFVETAPWTFVRHAVVTGHEENGQIRIQSGVNAGDRVVVAGGVLLND
ncbi:efflux RND transporter periplasmic adaptor subunit [Glaciimonas soli]|uniref:Efflux RND transporter periplasmic adaptor subunit n=1 Tax=Glaciimonas soli TaxID=2590999 RepID=A0A843YL48_9BURK|nr:efflux RND transporter periplasmic adaptor subunit [Glaciimonas soli]MQQ99659.1 efflux RND transporter periplasmic adaptor subunit [Glaciimonas soli]